MSLFPNTAKKFIHKSFKKTQFNNLYNSIGMPTPFDVTLRDGLQGLTIEEQQNFTTINKEILYDYIIKNYNPPNIEIGSFVNSKILPIFKDTDKLLNYVNKKCYDNINNYVLVPNMLQLQNALNSGAKNFSFITSVSESFQYKNTKMSLTENLENINNMMLYLDDYRNFDIDSDTGEIINNFKPNYIKIYVSCINHCPIEGEIKFSRIISELIKINKLNPTKICLSDTCGNLKSEDFTSIINYCKEGGIDIKKFSLHLHIHPHREKEAEKIFHEALDNGINEFDVSAVNTGGCSVTMDKSKLTPNMNYEQYYKFLTSYLMDKF
jgi:hydroxymethylglutaryl-CoA lyase